MIRLPIPAILLIFLGFSLPLFAQEQPTISVRTMSLGNGKMPELFYVAKGKDKLTPVVWSSRQPSLAVLAVHDGTIALMRMEVGEDGEEKPVVANRVKIPEGAKEVLLFAWIDADELKFYAVKDDFLTATYDSWLLINLSTKNIEFKIGKATKPVRLLKEQSKLYKITVAEEDGATVLGRANIRDKVRFFYSTYLPVKAERRTIIIFTDQGDKIRTTPVIDSFNRRIKADKKSDSKQ